MKRRNFLAKAGLATVSGVLANQSMRDPINLNQLANAIAIQPAAAGMVAPKDRADYLAAAGKATLRTIMRVLETWDPARPDLDPFTVSGGAFQIPQETRDRLWNQQKIWQGDDPGSPENQSRMALVLLSQVHSLEWLRSSIGERHGRMVIDYDRWLQSMSLAASTPGWKSLAATDGRILWSRFCWELWNLLGWKRSVAFPVQGHTPETAPWSSPFGWRTHPIYHTTRFHQGADIAVPQGTVLVATEDGTVDELLPDNGGAGNTLHFVTDFDRALHKHFHLSGYLVEAGTWVPRGTPISLVGNTGASTGSHCHFEVWWCGQCMNPRFYLEWAT